MKKLITIAILGAFCSVALFTATPTWADGKKFAYITPSLTLPFWRYLAKGIEDKVVAAGDELTTYDSNNNASTQLANAQDAIARKVDGILISPTDSSTCPKVLSLAEKAGIPVIIADIGTDSGNYLSFIISDNYDGANAVGKMLGAEFKKKGWEGAEYAQVTISLARANGRKRTEGFRKAMQEAGAKEVDLKQMETYTGDETFRYVQDMLTAHPNLKKKIHYHGLCDLPTEVHCLPNLQAKLDLESLYVKRDDQTNPVFGGNKVRKLEFTLAEAAQTNFNTVITFGFAGSNHATATAVHCKAFNLDCVSMLMPQPNAAYVRQNLLLSHAQGADLRHFTKKFRLSLATMAESLKRGVKTGKTPYIIPPGGTSPQGTLGFINAALELKGQIDAGVLEAPDHIYVALGTAGTSIGLLIGLKLAELKTRLVPVRVVDHDFMNQALASKLFRDTIAFLRSKDPSFPQLDWRDEDFQIEDGFLGKGYAHFTQEGMEAVSIARDLENCSRPRLAHC